MLEVEGNVVKIPGPYDNSHPYESQRRSHLALFHKYIRPFPRQAQKWSRFDSLRKGR